MAAIQRERPHITIVCSPNNPSGNVTRSEVVTKLADATDGIIVVDEAYIEFAGDPKGNIRALRDHSNLVVTRTLSKAWRLAGARLGYLLGPGWLIDGLARVRLPYNLSSLTQAVALASIAHADETLGRIGSIVTERDRIIEALDKLGVETFPSDANFVLFRVPDAASVWQGLLDRDVLIRNYATQDGLANCLRVTAGTPEETEAFLGAIEEVLGAGSAGPKKEVAS